jgi:plastocyanin
MNWTRYHRTGFLAAAAAVAALAVPGAGAAPATVTVSMTDFAFKLSRQSAPRGIVLFRIVNRGDVPHDFKIAGKKSPIYAAGKGGTLRVTFKKAGRYPFVCAVPGHAGLGMKGVFRVR